MATQQAPGARPWRPFRTSERGSTLVGTLPSNADHTPDQALHVQIGDIAGLAVRNGAALGGSLRCTITRTGGTTMAAAGRRDEIRARRTIGPVFLTLMH